MGFVIMCIWLLICTLFSLSIDSVWLGLLIGTLVCVAIGVLIWAFISGISNIQEYRVAKNKYYFDELKSGIIKLSIAIPSTVLLITFCIFMFSLIGGGSSSSNKCLNCGKEGNYSNGWCYSCYKEVEEQVRDDYYNQWNGD